jgi:hypothetical protein
VTAPVLHPSQDVASPSVRPELHQLPGSGPACCRQISLSRASLRSMDSWWFSAGTCPGVPPIPRRGLPASTPTRHSDRGRAKLTMSVMGTTSRHPPSESMSTPSLAGPSVPAGISATPPSAGSALMGPSPIGPRCPASLDRRRITRALSTVGTSMRWGGWAGTAQGQRRVLCHSLQSLRVEASRAGPTRSRSLWACSRRGSWQPLAAASSSWAASRRAVRQQTRFGRRPDS